MLPGPSSNGQGEDAWNLSAVTTLCNQPVAIVGDHNDTFQPLEGRFPLVKTQPRGPIPH